MNNAESSPRLPDCDGELVPYSMVGQEGNGGAARLEKAFRNQECFETTGFTCCYSNHKSSFTVVLYQVFLSSEHVKSNLQGLLVTT